MRICAFTSAVGEILFRHHGAELLALHHRKLAALHQCIRQLIGHAVAEINLSPPRRLVFKARHGNDFFQGCAVRGDYEPQRRQGESQKFAKRPSVGNACSHVLPPDQWVATAATRMRTGGRIFQTHFP